MRAKPLPNGALRTCTNCVSNIDGACADDGTGLLDGLNWCRRHETEAEFDEDILAIKRFRVAIGLPANWGGDE